MTRRGGLGRGLGALIAPAPPALAPSADRLSVVRDPAHPFAPSAEGPATPFGGGEQATSLASSATGEAGGSVAGELRLVRVADVVPNPRQPRVAFDESAMDELASSIRAVGLLQPVVVRDVGQPGERPRYELVMGERRWRASQQAGLAELPAIVRTTADDALLRDALLENLHREQLNPLEEAAAYQQLLEDFSCTHDDLAGRVGRSRSHVTNTVRLLGLPTPVQRRVAAGVLSAGHARALLALDDAGEQEDLATRVVAEGLSVRAVEELVAVRAAPRRENTVRHPRQLLPELQEVAEQLSDSLETRVKVVMGRTKGQITVEFASVEDLARITAAMGVAPTRDPVAPGA